MQRVPGTGPQISRPHGLAMLGQHAIMHMVQETGPQSLELLGTHRLQGHAEEEGHDKGFCQRRMVTAEDPFSHMYGGSSEFDIAAFSTTFDRKSFGRRIVAKINTNINKPTISADRSWAYLNFGSTHKHHFLYDTGTLVTLITPQTFEHAHQNGKVGRKWTGHGISIKNASKGAMEITGVYTVHFSIDGRDMDEPFIVTPEASSNIIGMNVIRTYKLKMDVLSTTVTASCQRQ
jgi:predicted aspartyl protease